MNLNLFPFSDEELEKELEQREKERKKEKPPERLAFVDLTALRKICSDYIKFCASDDYHEDNDFNQHIFETAIKAYYGKNIFDWVNKVTEG